MKLQLKGQRKHEELLSCLIDELRNVMFLVGAENLESLAKVPVVVSWKNCRVAQHPRLRHSEVCAEEHVNI